MNKAIYEKNTKILKEIYPHIADYMEEHRETEFDYRAGVSAVADKLVLYIEREGAICQFDTLYDSDKVVDIWYQSLPKINLNAKIIIYGFGNGMYIKKLLKMTSEDVKVIVYEPSLPLFATVMEEFDITDILASKRVVFMLSGAEQMMLREKFYEQLTYTDLEGMIYRTHMNYREVFPEEYAIYFNELQNTYNAIISSQSVIGRYGEAYYINTLANFPYFIKGKSIEDFYQRIKAHSKSMPAFVVAAGPSLDKNVQELKHAKGKSFIIAVDTAMRPLIRNGVIPDICISIDGEKSTKHFSDEAAKEVPLICYLVSNWALMNSHIAEKFFINDLNAHVQSFLTDRNKILPAVSGGGTVSNDAFSIAQMLGFQTIVLVGQDLAYTDNKTHSDTTVRGEQQLTTTTKKEVMIEGIDGNPIRSSIEFQIYLKWYEEQIRKYNKLKIIDATEGGAKIHGSIIKPLKEVIAEECNEKFDFSACISQTTDYFNETEKEEFVAYMDAIPKYLSECLVTANQGLRAYEKMLVMVHQNKYHNKQMQKLFEEVKKAGDYLEKQPIMEYVQNLIQEVTTSVLKDVYITEDDERKELLVTCQKGRDYLIVVRDKLEYLTANTAEMLVHVHDKMVRIED